MKNIIKTLTNTYVKYGCFCTDIIKIMWHKIEVEGRIFTYWDKMSDITIFEQYEKDKVICWYNTNIGGRIQWEHPITTYSDID